jgi:hypothetical protein
MTQTICYQMSCQPPDPAEPEPTGAPRTASVGIRVHFGTRVRNDDFIAAALNGPYSDAGTLHAGGYHFRFNAETASTFLAMSGRRDRAFVVDSVVLRSVKQ